MLSVTALGKGVFLGGGGKVRRVTLIMSDSTLAVSTQNACLSVEAVAPEISASSVARISASFFRGSRRAKKEALILLSTTEVLT